MAEIVNLRQARKRAAKDRSERLAAGNRAAFGATKTERQTRQIEVDRACRLLDGAKRDQGRSEAPTPIIPDDQA